MLLRKLLFSSSIPNMGRDIMFSLTGKLVNAMVQALQLTDIDKYNIDVILFV